MSAPQVVLHLHPDWPGAGGTTVLEGLVRERLYLSQFATGTSNGGLTAHPGGDRWRWESRLFDARYDDAAARERPVHGAWDHRCDPRGAAVRFGSAHLRLRPEVTVRATFCFPDSVLEPTDVGGPELLDHLGRLADAAAAAPGADPLDDDVEAHVHGPVRLPDDVEALVLDPCFAGTAVDDTARRLGCEVASHDGFRAATADLEDAYRGPGPAALARSLAAELTPDVLGAAARAGWHDPQDLERAWHLLAHAVLTS